MELIFKLLKDKPPSMGIVYETNYMASRKYEEVLEYFLNEEAKIKLELQNDSLNLTIKSGTKKIEYKKLKFKTNRLKDFITHVKKDTSFYFVHCYVLNDTETIALPPGDKPKFIMVNGYQIVKEY